MTTANHVLVGSSIALVLSNPYLIIPAAFASHYLLDALPHNGFEGEGYGEAIKHKSTYFMEIFGLLALVLLVFTIDFSVWLTLFAAILAVSPDFEWPYRYFFFERKGKIPPSTFMTKFHQKVQWCEKPWGIYVEIVFFLIGYFVLTKYII